MEYENIRTLHITCALLSLGGFIVRGIWMLRQAPLLQHRLSRTLPHVNDTLLLGAAIALVVQSGQMPWSTPWLSAKIFGLLTYIGLGVVALRRGPTLRIRLGAWLAALVVFGWMLSVARLRTPAGFLFLLAGA